MQVVSNLYYVAVVKDSSYCFLAAGPFIEQTLAEDSIATLPSISKSCKYVIATQEVSLTLMG